MTDANRNLVDADLEQSLKERGGPVRCCREWPECSHMLAWYEKHVRPAGVTDAIDTLRMALGSQASAIKSREPWTATCERVQDEGRHALDRLKTLVRAAERVETYLPVSSITEPLTTPVANLLSALRAVKGEQ